ncbi:conserved hypothetical protein [Trichinella spiralis]|uniref:hypothetical protein n=1 Tax=Trichinella spiralis TaxID=6334 RepID=UPI0001EFDB5A|nr:conserved hypothetical protein [Trichinella spiralis]
MTWKLEFEFGAEMRFQSIQPELHFSKRYRSALVRSCYFLGFNFQLTPTPGVKLIDIGQYTHTHICVCVLVAPARVGRLSISSILCLHAIFPFSSSLTDGDRRSPQTREDTRRMTTTSPEQLLSLAGLPGQNRSQAVLDDQQMLLRCWDCACRKELTLEL